MFDFDGTVFDTGEGIMKSVQYAAEAFGYSEPDWRALRSFVGPPLVESFARRLQIQERLTEQIAQCLLETLQPKGVIVVCEAQHLCMSMRGVQKNPTIITSALRGLFKRDPKTRAEFMQLIK